MAHPADLPPALEQKLADIERLEPKEQKGGLGDPDNTSLAPYEVPETLRATIDELDMWQNLADMQEKGYTVLTDCASEALCDELCHLIRYGEDSSGDGAERPGVGHVLGNHPLPCVFEAVTMPKMMALSEVMCGKGFRLSQCAASVQQQNPSQTGLPKAGLHADANWTPAPFPEHNQIVTGCFVLSEDYTLENGATCLVRSLGSALVQQSET